MLFPDLVGGPTPPKRLRSPLGRRRHRRRLLAFLLAGLFLRKGRTLATAGRMSERGLRVAGAALVVMVGIWAGIRVHSSLTRRGADRRHRDPGGRGQPPDSERPRRSAAGGLAAADYRSPTVCPPSPCGILAETDLDRHLEGQIPGHQLLGDLVRALPPGDSAARATSRRNGQIAAVTVIGIAVDHRASGAHYAQELKIAYPMLIGEQDALESPHAFGVESPVFPFTVFTDRRATSWRSMWVSCTRLRRT